MDWMKAHLTLVYGIGLGLLVLSGAVLVSNKFATYGGGDSYTWGTYNGAGRFVPTEQFIGSSRNDAPLEVPITIEELSRTLQTNPDRVYASLGPGGTAPASNNFFGTTTAEGVIELGADAVDALLKSIKPTAYTGNLTADEGTLDEIYHFIPKNIGSVGVSEQSKMTKAQQELYNYGNEAGSFIELYSSIWAPVQAGIHRSYVEDRGNPEKATALKKLGNGLYEVGLGLGGMEIIPSAMTKQHRDLVAAYKTAGEKTEAIAFAITDDDLYVALVDYNRSADEFLRSYLAITTVFTLNSVTFKETDPGSVFVYNASQTF